MAANMILINNGRPYVSLVKNIPITLHVDSTIIIITFFDSLKNNELEKCELASPVRPLSSSCVARKISARVLLFLFSSFLDCFVPAWKDATDKVSNSISQTSEYAIGYVNIRRKLQMYGIY